MKLNETTRQKGTSCCCNVISTEKLERIVKTIDVYSDSSGTKCCAFKFIDDLLLRKEIQPLANNNINITHASHLLLFYTWDKSAPGINSFDFAHTNSNSAVITNSRKTCNKNCNHQCNYNFIHNVQSTYQALDAGLKMAAAERVDAFLIEDLHYNQIDALLHLRQNGYRSVAFLALNF